MVNIWFRKCFYFDSWIRCESDTTQDITVMMVKSDVTLCLNANGNITSLSRNDQTGAAMDNLTYHYAMDKAGNILNNRLLHVNDAVRNNATTTDIKDQGNYGQQRPSTHNYAYDEVGNLIKDKSEQIAEIKWTVTGKVSDVIRTNGSSKPDLHFDHDAMGQRISKTVTNKNVTTGDKFVTTYYVRNPQGNVLAVYEHKHGDSDNGTFTLTEQHLYGASRLGMKKRDLALNVANASEPTPVTHYELTNHLGNVLAVISDKASSTNEPTVVSLSDYYPFGMEMEGRSYSVGDYRYGFNGKEKDDANGIHLDFGARIYDSRIGRFLSVDPDVENTMNSFSFASNSPIFCIDYNGRFGIVVSADAHNKDGITKEKLIPLEKILFCIKDIIGGDEDDNNIVLKEIVRQTGYTKEKIRKIFTYGDNTMNVKIKTYEECGNSMGQGGHGEGACIASNLIDMLNDENLSDNDRVALTFAVAELIIHEAVHEMDALNNKKPVYNVHKYVYESTPTITKGTEGDMGNQNSTSVFGHRPISVETAMWGYPDAADPNNRFSLSDGNGGDFNWGSVRWKFYGMLNSDHAGAEKKRFGNAAKNNKTIAEK